MEAIIFKNILILYYIQIHNFHTIYTLLCSHFWYFHNFAFNYFTIYSTFTQPFHTISTPFSHLNILFLTTIHSFSSLRLFLVHFCIIYSKHIVLQFLTLLSPSTFTPIFQHLRPHFIQRPFIHITYSIYTLLHISTIFLF